MNWTPPKKVELSDKGLYDFLKLDAKIDGKQTFVFSERERYTMGESVEIIGALIIKLSSLGVKKGDFVGLRATRAYDTVFIIIALQAIGAVAVLTDPHFGLKAFLDGCGTDIPVKLYITNERASEDISASGNWKANDVDLTISAEGYDQKAVEELTAGIDTGGPGVIVFTSGSTGKSKAVLQTQKSYINNSVEGEPTQGHEEGDVAIALLPLYHIFGIAVIANALVTRHSIFFPDNIDPENTLRCIEKYGITRMYSVPTYFLAMINGDKHKKYDLSKFRFGLIAGGPNTTEQYRQMEDELGIRIVIVYGMSEYFGISRTTYDMPYELRSIGVGTFNPNNEGFILDDDGNELPRGQEGEICVRGYAMMLEYYNNEEETKKAIDSEGRFHTGDLGYIDDRGILHISGRKKDIIIRAGENLSAQKIENAIVDLPGVLRVAVVGIKDELLGEVPAALVQHCGSEKLTQEDILKMLAGKLSKIELPVKIMFTNNMPQTSTGKTDKQKIKELFN